MTEKSLPLVLASSSPYRKSILERLHLQFDTSSPDVDETPYPNESPNQLVARLSAAKAKALRNEFPQHLIIGSDQVAVLNEKQILGKPGTIEKAIQQLKACSGKQVTFLTGISLYNSATEQIRTLVEPYEVGFRDLTDEEISTYVAMEQPLNCAGSFKSEGLGIALFSYLHGDDPNALVGLPVIRLLELLRAFGVSPFSLELNKS